MARSSGEHGRATGIDLFAGRNAYGALRTLGLDAIAVDYVIVDTVRVARETFASILEAWRDGYAAAIGENTAIDAASATAYFDQMIANVRNPSAYAVWMVPVVSARVPE